MSHTDHCSHFSFTGHIRLVLRAKHVHSYFAQRTIGQFVTVPMLLSYI